MLLVKLAVQVYRSIGLYRHFSDLNLGQTCMALKLELETRFLEVLNTS